MDAAWYRIRMRLPTASKTLAEYKESRPAFRRRVLTLDKPAEVAGTVPLNEGPAAQINDESVRTYLEQEETR